MLRVGHAKVLAAGAPAGRGRASDLAGRGGAKARAQDRDARLVGLEGGFLKAFPRNPIGFRYFGGVFNMFVDRSVFFWRSCDVQ